jgi:hypothetical protein
MYFSFNKIYSKLIFIYIFIQYLIIISIFTYNIFYYNNDYLSDNLLIINNILLDNYSIFENINLDISNNPELNTNFNVVYFDNNNSLIPSNNNGNDNNMNNMNNMNNKNNFDDLNINDIFNKSKKNTEDDSNTDTITLFNRIIHLKNTNPLILDMIKTYVFDNDNNILQDESLPLVNNDFINNKDKDNNLLTLNNNFDNNNNNNNNFNNNNNNNNNFMKIINPIFEENNSKDELKMPCRIIGPYANLPITNKTGTMLSLPFYNGTPTTLERLSYELNGTVPEDFSSVSTTKNIIKEDTLELNKVENTNISTNKNKSIFLETENIISKKKLAELCDFSDLFKPKNEVASSSKIDDSSFIQGSSKINSDLLSDPLNFLPEDLYLSHILTIEDPNRSDIQPFVGGFDVYGNIHLPMEVLDNYLIPDYMFLNYNCFAQYDYDLHPVLFNGMLEEAWKNNYLDTIIEFYLEDHNMYNTHFTKENITVIIEFLRDKIKYSNSQTTNTISILDKGKGRAF